MSIFKKVLKRLSVTITAAMMFTYAVNSVIASADNIYQINSFTGHCQEMSNWCWVASAETSGKYLVNSSKTQTNAVQYVKNNVVNEGGTIYETAEAANYFTNNQYNYVGYNQAYSITFLQGQITSNRLPILSAGYYNSLGQRYAGHATTGYMVAYCGDGTKLIGYYDPWDGGRRYICTFYDFCNGGYNGRKYDRTIYTNV